MNTNINELREHLMGTLASLRDRDNPMEPDRARAVAQVASVLVDTARVEVDYIKATDHKESAFLSGPDVARLASNEPTAHNPFPRVVRHQLAG
jgi:hypothetical protein